jgi:hypothetical protein
MKHCFFMMLDHIEFFCFQKQNWLHVLTRYSIVSIVHDKHIKRIAILSRAMENVEALARL